jgi:hypothetical protein
MHSCYKAGLSVPWLPFVASLKNSAKLIFRHPVRLAFLAGMGLFIWIVSGYYLPEGKGFTAFLRLGDKMGAGYLPELRAAQPYLETDSYGYDGQSYVQIAMRPRLSDPVLASAVDNLPYRARRILFCWTASLLGGGDPVRAMHVFSLQNVACWLLLGVLLLRWFPMVCWEDLWRWMGVMFSFGLMISVCSSLMDGPSLLLVAGGMALAEAGHRWSSTVVLAISGLGKETNILAAAGPGWPAAKSLREWAMAAGRVLLVVAPLAVWGWFLADRFGWTDSRGTENFSWPLSGWWKKWLATFASIKAEGWKHFTLSSLLMQISLTAQFLFFILHWRWNDGWWRLGAVFALLMTVLGDAVWEGYPGAASRVLLPMALAFNIMVPRHGVKWRLILLLGNLTIISTAVTPTLPLRESYEVGGVPELLRVAGGGKGMEVGFQDGWHGPERSRWEYWRWSKGPAVVEVHNRHAFAISARLGFHIKSVDQRTVTLSLNEDVLWSGKTGPELQPVSTGPVTLQPGINVITFSTPEIARQVRPDDPRVLAFSLRNLEIVVTGKQ